jgi:hypothetical protein
MLPGGSSVANKVYECPEDHRRSLRSATLCRKHIREEDEIDPDEQ